MQGFGDFYNTTVLHPVGLASVLILGVAIFFLPRQYAVVPMLILACFIPSAQRLVIMGMDWTLLRILILFGWTRLILRNEFKGFHWNKLDTLVVAWMVSGTLIMTIQAETMAAFIYRCGWMFDGFGMYFFFRCVLREWEDFERLLQWIAYISIPVSVAFLIEWFTGRNAFAIFGGVPQITIVREGRLRCQGAFSHAILAGTFWATILPLVVANFAQGKKWVATCSVIACLVIVFTCSSSTPLMTIGFGVIGLAFYFLRRDLRPIRWGFFGLLVLLHFLMDKPVWHLIARVNVVSGSTGWHRFRIMDATINNFSKWWLLGDPNPMAWGVWEMRDITNQYILEALRGGLLSLVFFVAAIVVAFMFIGKALRAYEDSRPHRIFIWCVGVTLFAHVWTFFATSYFGQIIMVWYLTLGVIGSIREITVAEAEDSPVAADEEFIPDAEIIEEPSRPHIPEYWLPDNRSRG